MQAVIKAAPNQHPALRRDRDAGLLGGVCAGLAERLGVDPILPRIGFAVAALATAGFAVIVYLACWLLIGPSDSQSSATHTTARGSGRRRRGWRIGAGAGLLLLAALLAFRELGIWWSDAIVWPAVLATSGAALLWGLSSAPATTSVAPGPAEWPAGPGSIPSPSDPPGARRSPANLYRGGFGVALVVGAMLLFLSANDALGATRDTVLAALAAITALALILAPFLWRLGRNLASERAERIRSQERAEVAAHVHDSVLQTLTLMQKRADDPREVAALARRQERELRSWLLDREGGRSSNSLATALEAAAAEIEDAHSVAIDPVIVGDAALDQRGEALVAAAREALANAAKFGAGSGPVSLYAELAPARAEVFVRDRGPGFDLEAVPGDRRGVRESIIGRMQRHGGQATIRPAPGAGTEVELAIELGGEHR